MVDVYPFTEYDTIEVRVFDTQLSVPRRVGIALILQALALKAKHMVEEGESVPDIGAKCLAANRESAVAAGLWGPFKTADNHEEVPYVTIYNSAIGEDGSIIESRPNRFMADAVSSMLYLIKKELDDIGAIDNSFMQPLLVSLFGSESSEPKTTGADFQLDVYAKSDMNIVVLLKRLADITRECCTNWLYDPLEGTPHLPAWLCWWKGLEPEIAVDSDRIFGGQDGGFSISLRNSTNHDFKDLNIAYTIEDSERHVTDHKVFSIARMTPRQTNTTKIPFKTTIAATAYNVIVTLGIAGKSINLSTTINTYWMKTTIRPSATTQFADGRGRISFSGEIETNYPSSIRLNIGVSVLSIKKEKALAQTSRVQIVERGDTLLFDESMFPSLTIPTDASQGVERCVLRIDLVDEAGTLVSTSTSRPFYVGFANQGPLILLRTNARSVHASGDLVHGEVELKGRGGILPKEARLVIAFLSDSGAVLGIGECNASQLLRDTYRFDWTVPHVESEETADRSGAIVAQLLNQGEEMSRAESARIRIALLNIRMSIDSLRAPERSIVGEAVSGWLRIERNTDLGDPATLVMKLQFPNGEEHHVVEQSIKPNKNLSVAYGPIVIPKPTAMSNPKLVTLVAELRYGGTLLDRMTTDINLTASPRDETIALAISGVPRFAAPDELVRLAVVIGNNSLSDVECQLVAKLDSVVGTNEILNQDLELSSQQTRTFDVPFRVPLAAEMSSAELIVVADHAGSKCEARQIIKVKAMEQALFHVGFSLKNERGEEVRGLIPRQSPLNITLKVMCPRSEIQGLEVALRIMSRRQVMMEFRIPVQTSNTLNFETRVGWLTPPVELVTGYYLEAVVSVDGRALPSRAVSIEERQFTVY
jgi:hypothetical protein